MFRRRYTSIAEEPENEKNTTRGAESDESAGLSVEVNGSTENGELLNRLVSLNTTKSLTSALSEDESGSDRYSISDDEYIFADDEDNPDLNESPDKDKHLSAKQINNDVKNVSKKEEEALKSSKLTQDQIREVKEAFRVFDTNGDGCITATELKKLVTSLGYNITEAELMDMMNQIDADGNGAIDFPEFLALMSKNLDDCDPEDILKESFKVFDRDGSGFIGVSELDRVFKLLGQDFKDYEIEAMIKAADVDGDGLVGFDDFMKMMNV